MEYKVPLGDTLNIISNGTNNLEKILSFEKLKNFMANRMNKNPKNSVVSMWINEARINKVKNIDQYLRFVGSWTNVRKTKAEINRMGNARRFGWRSAASR
jgi:hypothetical protein